MMRCIALWTLGIVLCAASSALCQGDYRRESVVDLGVEYRVYDKLKSTPLKLGRTEPSLKAKFEPTETSDFMYGSSGRAKWYLRLRAFERAKGAVTGEAVEEEGVPATAQDPRIAQMIANLKAKSFEDWARHEANGGNVFLTEGKSYRAKGKRPAYTLWEYYRVEEGVQGKVEWFSVAACYDIDGKDVVLICTQPVKKKHRPDSKWFKYAKSMVTSLSVKEFDDVEDEGDEDLDKFADTPEKKASLERAKKNIENLQNWTYYTTPDYIILYSWNLEKGTKGRRESTKFAKKVGRQVQEIRELFEETYPPDGRSFPYSIIRVCSDYAEFSNYGNTSGGVVGWFSPGSKELVVFFDADRRFGGLDIIEVCYHEAWHQYSDSYWPSEVTLHRWFDEGLAEYFAQYEKAGRGWRRETLNGRFRSIRDQINVGNFIPIKDIVYWPRSLFYGARAPDHYAQAYSMADFVLRGKKKLGKRWDPAWGGIMRRYGDVCLEIKDRSEGAEPKKATEEAFKDVDFDAFTEAWITWVTKHMNK